MKAYQENFHHAALWIRCGERAFFHPDQADAALHNGRASSIDIQEEGPWLLNARAEAPGADRVADALVPDGSDHATRFSLVHVGGRWKILGIENLACYGDT